MSPSEVCILAPALTVLAGRDSGFCELAVAFVAPFFLVLTDSGFAALGLLIFLTFTEISDSTDLALAVGVLGDFLEAVPVLFVAVLGAADLLFAGFLLAAFADRLLTVAELAFALVAVLTVLLLTACLAVFFVAALTGFFFGVDFFVLLVDFAAEVTRPVTTFLVAAFLGFVDFLVAAAVFAVVFFCAADAAFFPVVPVD